MAAKIVLGAKPKTFKSFEVKVTLPDGGEGIIPVTFKYRTKREFGKWVDDAAENAKIERKQEDVSEFSWASFYEQGIDLTVSQLLTAIDSWGLDIPLTRESLMQLDDEMPAAAVAVLNAYGAACREGRLGN